VGTGKYAGGRTWYELTDGKLVEVLSFPLEGEALQRRIQSEVAGVSSNGGDDKVTVRMTASFKSMEVRRKLSFSRTGSSSQFVFDPRDSDISETAYRALHDIASESFTPGVLRK
jgi:hypothetical protein